MTALVSVQDAAAASSSGRATLIDVRTADEFARGHSAHATFMPLPVVPLRLSELTRSDTYYVVCESGGRSAQAVQYLQNQGYDAHSVDGGMASWRAAGLETTTTTL